MKRQLKLLPIYIGLAGIMSAGLVQGKEPVPWMLAANQKPGSNNAATFEHVHSLAMDSGGQALFLGAHTGLFRSDDRGRTWKKVAISTKHKHLDVMDIAADPRDPQTI